MVSRKRIFDPFQAADIQSIQQNTIETAIAIRLAEQIVLRREDDPSLLGQRDTCPGPAEISAAAQANLDEHQRLAIAANQVDLAAANTEIAFNNA